MKVGVISDIHGNLPALEAALDALEERGVDSVVCAGDVVGILGWNAAVAERIRDRCDAVVIGNHDRRVIPEWDFTPTREDEQIEYEMVAQQLTDAQFGWLSSLPEETWTAGETLRLVHVHPNPEERWGGRGGVKPKHFVKMGRHIDGEMLVMGHTHDQHAVAVGKFQGHRGAALNPGSVGVPYYEPADFAVVEPPAPDESWDDDHFELLSADYDEQRVVDRLSNLGVYEDMRQIAKSRNPHNRAPGF